MDAAETRQLMQQLHAKPVPPMRKPHPLLKSAGQSRPMVVVLTGHPATVTVKVLGGQPLELPCDQLDSLHTLMQRVPGKWLSVGRRIDETRSVCEYPPGFIVKKPAEPAIDQPIVDAVAAIEPIAVEPSAPAAPGRGLDAAFVRELHSLVLKHFPDSADSVSARILRELNG